MYISFLCSDIVSGAKQEIATPKNFSTFYILNCSDAIVELKAKCLDFFLCLIPLQNTSEQICQLGTRPLQENVSYFHVLKNGRLDLNINKRDLEFC